MERRLHEELSKFLSQHNVADVISNIDEIVLSYMLGIIELIGNGEVEDCFDLEDVMEMMNAYLPGFDTIASSDVMEWMFSLSHKLNETENNEILKCHEGTYSPGGTPEKSCLSEHDNPSEGQKDHDPVHMKKSSFPSYDFTNSSSQSQETKPSEFLSSSKPVEDSTSNPKEPTQSAQSLPPFQSQPFPQSGSVSTNGRDRAKISKRKGRQLSCSSQESQDESTASKSELVSVDDESQVRSLLEMFPAACTMEVRQCLQLSNGDMDRAAQLIIDRQEAGQAINSSSSSSKTMKKKKSFLDANCDETIKASVLERYSFVDTDDDKKTYKPPPVKTDTKKMVRYRDNQVVSLKGERFSEVKKKDTEEMKATYVNLKPARKYRFH